MWRVNMEQVGVGAFGTPYELDPGKDDGHKRIGGGQSYSAGRTAVGYSTVRIEVGAWLLLRAWSTDCLLIVGESVHVTHWVEVGADGAVLQVQR